MPKTTKTPILINHREVAAMLGMTPQNIRRWVAMGSFPEPHSIIESLWFYRTNVVRAFVDTGKWPEGTKFRPGVGRGHYSE
jgi:predicted DNA-binding transcriptional regulator AlpA